MICARNGMRPSDSSESAGRYATTQAITPGLGIIFCSSGSRATLSKPARDDSAATGTVPNNTRGIGTSHAQGLHLRRLLVRFCGTPTSTAKLADILHPRRSAVGFGFRIGFDADFTAGLTDEFKADFVLLAMIASPVWCFVKKQCCH
jgi:hypothetical protein